MKKIFLFVLLGLILYPSVTSANHYTQKKRVILDGPVKTPDLSYVSIDLNETTGLMTLYFVGDVGNVEMTISQNDVVFDYDNIAGSNGGTATYSFSSYAVGEYLLTLETTSGFMVQYIITVEDD